jgi:hypothetical protein
LIGYHHHQLLSVTPGLSLLPNASYGRDRELLYQVFSAATKLRDNIMAEASAVIENLPPIIPDHVFALPAVSRLRTHQGDGGCLEFEIKDHYGCREAHRHLFLAHFKDSDTKILVKFSRTYSLELHQYCLDHGHALRILAYEILPGGWHAIGMDYLEGAVPLDKPDLQELVMDFVLDLHRAGFVHGDLRSPNILCKGSDFSIVDFDLGGKVGDVKYPTVNLNPQLREVRTANDLIIRPEDDIRVLEVMFKSLA